MKRMGKRPLQGIKVIVSLLLAVVLVISPFGMGSIAAFGQEPERTFDIGINAESVTATLDSQGLLTLSGVGEIKDFTPETAPFLEVAAEVRQVVLGGGISSIGDYTFYGCGNLQGGLSLPEGVVRIGTGAFSGESYEAAPKFSTIENLFVEATITVPKNSGGEASLSPLAQSPVPSPAPAQGAGGIADETQLPKEDSLGELSSLKQDLQGKEAGEELSPTGEESSPAATAAPSAMPTPAVTPGPTAVPSPAATALPTETQKPTPEATAESKFELLHITQQTMGSNVFYPLPEGERGYFSARPENQRFIQAMLAAGYLSAQRMVPAVLDYGKGSCEQGALTVKLPVYEGKLEIPSLPQAFIAPESSSLFSYSFEGWTESEDPANCVRQPATEYEPKSRESLYFIASWKRTVLLSISSVQEEGTLVLSLPEISDYDYVKIQWQTAKISAGGGEDLNEAELAFEDIPGEETQTYRRELSPQDENRVFRAVVTVKKPSFFRSIFGAEEQEQFSFDSVRTAVQPRIGTYSITCSAGSYAGATISGETAAVEVAGDDYGVIPPCGFTASGVGNLVFNGWTDGEGNTYDPGDMIRMNQNLSLTANWEVATVCYIDGTIKAADARKNDGSTASKPVGYFVTSGINRGAYNQLPAGGTKYTNIIVICGNVSSVQNLPNQAATITNVAPDGTAYTGSFNLAGDVNLGGETVFRDVTITGLNDGGENSGIYACGNKLMFSENVTVNSGLAVSGGAHRGDLSGSTELVLQSGTFLSVYGGNCPGGNVSGGTLVSMSGTAYADVVIGGAWYGGNVTGTNRNGFGTEILLGGNAGAGVIGGGGRDSNATSVSAQTHVVVGGNARVQKKGLDTDVTKGYVAGSGLDAISVDSAGNARGGTLVEIRENAFVSDGVFGGSGDAFSSSSDTALISTTGDTKIVMTGGQVGYLAGGGNQRATAGSTSVALLGGKVNGSVYGGGYYGNVVQPGNGTVVINGGEVVGDVYGGGFYGDIAGNSVVQVLSGKIGGSLYGGGDQGGINGNVQLSVESGEILKNVFGGGKGASGSAVAGTVTGLVSVRLLGGQIGTYGADSTLAPSTGNLAAGGEYAPVTGTATVEIQAAVTGTGFPNVGDSVYGGGYYASVQKGEVRMLDGQIGGSLYGGGYGSVDAVCQGTRLFMQGGNVQGNLYGGGALGIVQSVGTQVEISGGKVQGHVFGAGRGYSQPDGNETHLEMGGLYGPSVVAIRGGEISGNVYGGGDMGLVGFGSLSGTGDSLSATVTTGANTGVTLTGGTVGGSLFGGGSGAGGTVPFGTVFGNTQVDIQGGVLQGSVFGGSNRAYVTGNTQISIQGQLAPVSLAGVFGGGNLPGGDIPTFNENIYLVLGNSAITLDGSGAFDVLIRESIFASGNLTQVKGNSQTIQIKNYTGMLQSLQRAQTVDIVSSTLYLTGANDVTETITRYYSLAKVSNLRLIDGTTLRVDKETRELGAIGNYQMQGTSVAVSEAEASRSTLSVFQGKSLQIKENGVYGTVSGVLWLDIVSSGTGDYGVSIQASVDTNIGDGSSNTGAFIKANTPSSKDLPFIAGRVEGSHVYWRLGGNTSAVELTIQALHESSGGTGLVQQSFELPTTQGRTTYYKISKAALLSGGCNLVYPQNAETVPQLPPLGENETKGNTFYLRLDPTDGAIPGSWTDTGGGSYMLTKLPSGQTTWNSGVPGVWKMGSAYPTTAGLADRAEATFTLGYHPDFEIFSGGVVELTLKSYSQPTFTEEALENTIVVKLTIEGEGSASSRTASIAPGRKFAEITGQTPVSISEKGAITTSFVTEYYPESLGAAGMSLSLHSGTAEALLPAHFPAGTNIVLADTSIASNIKYYIYRVTADKASVNLADFAGMGGNTGAFFPGPVDNSTKITEKLLFAVDFSGVSVPLQAGDYFLRLTHSAAELAMQVSAFSVSVPEPITLDFIMDQRGNSVVHMSFTPHVAVNDTRYADGAGIRVTLADAGNVLRGFPSAVVLEGGMQSPMRDTDGTLSFGIPVNQPTELIMDFSGVSQTEMPPGEYRLTAYLRPKTGLQIGSTGEQADAVSLVKSFNLSYVQKEERAVKAELPDASQRLCDTSKAAAVLDFRLDVITKTGDNLSVKVYRKTGTTPEPSSYTELPEASRWYTVEPGGGSIVPVQLTVPQGTASGTYRVIFSVQDSTGVTVAQEPYNFIIK